jgi:DNA-binding MarR family transcriptional regulator
MEQQKCQERLIFKWLYMLKRQTDKMASTRLGDLVPGDFNSTYLPYFMNIGEEGISNHDLVHKIMVTKQGVSKTVKELERLELVYTGKSETDARSIMIYLTGKGLDLHRAVSRMAEEATAEYVKLVGAKKYEQFIDTLIKLSAYHEGE